MTCLYIDPRFFYQIIYFPGDAPRDRELLESRKCDLGGVLSHVRSAAGKKSDTYQLRREEA
jgi:hypothetical protein